MIDPFIEINKIRIGIFFLFTFLLSGFSEGKHEVKGLGHSPGECLKGRGAGGERGVHLLVPTMYVYLFFILCSERNCSEPQMT